MLVQELKENYGATMTPNNAAEVLHQHPAHIRKLCESGLLPAVKIGDRWHINTERFAAVLDGFNE